MDEIRRQTASVRCTMVEKLLRTYRYLYLGLIICGIDAPAIKIQTWRELFDPENVIIGGLDAFVKKYRM